MISKKQDLLDCTQTKLCIPIINRIYKKMRFGIKFPEIKVHGNLICDGHHRYLASLLANYALDITAWSSSPATIITDWELVIFEEEDWDTMAKIKMLNEQDAIYNKMPIEEIINLLN